MKFKWEPNSLGINAAGGRLSASTAGDPRPGPRITMNIDASAPDRPRLSRGFCVRSDAIRFPLRLTASSPVRIAGSSPLAESGHRPRPRLGGRGISQRRRRSGGPGGGAGALLLEISSMVLRGVSIRLRRRPPSAISVALQAVSGVQFRRFHAAVRDGRPQEPKESVRRRKRLLSLHGRRHFRVRKRFGWIQSVRVDYSSSI